MLAWPMIGRNFSVKTVNTLAATQLMNSRGALMVDVREPNEMARGLIPQAKSVPMSTFDAQVEGLVKEARAGREVKPVILFCASGWRSGMLGKRLKKAGLEEVFSLDGGFDAWKQAGLPTLEKKPT